MKDLALDALDTKIIAQLVAERDSLRAENERFRGALTKIAENKLVSPSPIGAAHGAGINMGIDMQAGIARAALREGKP